MIEQKMKNRKTRTQKERMEIKRLKEENYRLREINADLVGKLGENKKNDKSMSSCPSRKQVLYTYIYDSVVSSLILVFLYWLAINGYDNFNLPYNCSLILIVMVSLKCILGNKKLNFKVVIRVIVNDLLKPFGAMLLGLFLCIYCLGKEWRSAFGYALDVANMGVLIIFVIAVVIAIFLTTYAILFLKKQCRKLYVIIKRMMKQRCCK